MLPGYDSGTQNDTQSSIKSHETRIKPLYVEFIKELTKSSFKICETFLELMLIVT